MSPGNAAVLAWIAFGLALPISIAGANIGWGLVAAAGAFAALTRQPIPWGSHRSRLETALILYCLAAGLACLLGTDPRHSLRFINQDLHKLWLYLLFSVGLAALIAQGETRQSKLLAALASGFAVAAALGIAQTLGSERHGSLWVRAHAFVHPVTFGEQMAFAVLGGFCFLAAPTPETERWKPAAVILLCLCASALFLSQTRGAIAGLAAGFLVISIIARRSRLRLAAGGAALVSVLGFFASDLLPTGRSIVGSFSHYAGKPNPELARFTLWEVAWKMFLDHPWFGAGLNNYRTEFRHYFQGTLDGESAVGNAHNLYVHHLAERGVVGVLALAFLLFVLWRRSLERSRRDPDAWNLWAAGATAGFLVMNMTEVALQVEQVWMLFFFIWIWAEQRQRTKDVPCPS